MPVEIVQPAPPPATVVVTPPTAPATVTVQSGGTGPKGDEGDPGAAGPAGNTNNYIQLVEPTPTPGSGPFIWYQLNVGGEVIDIRKGVA